MSYLEKMSIQGIRSFGTDDKDKQVITFHTPLTLILGPNGTGKTTLIECMKYMTTGVTPAGGSQKGTFIHDPKIANETTVKAQVRLQLRNVSGKLYIIQRAMSATQMAKTIKCQTLDGVITTTGPDGKKVSITTRCADIDREMVSLLGVGKPILENVIFCHQEDSCWPLSEGKALKLKFDDIFASTRYVKALEIINKSRKDMQTEIKNHQIEVKHLKTHKETADKFKHDLEETMARCAASRESVKGIKEKLAPIEEKLLTISTKEGNIYQLHTALEKLKTEREQMNLAIQELRRNIENEFEGSTEQLREMIIEFETKVEGFETELRKSKRERERALEEQSKKNRERSTLLQSLGKLEHEAQENKSRIKKRESLIKEISAEHSISGYATVDDEEDVLNFLKEMHKLCTKLKKDASDRRADFEKQEQKVQKEIASETKKEAAVITEIKLKQETMETNSKTIKEIRAKLHRVEGSVDRLTGINQELKRTNQDLMEHEKSVDFGAGKKEIEKLTNRRDDLETSTRRLDTELTRMHSESGVRTQIEIHTKEKSAKEDQIRRLKAKNEDQLEILFCDDIPTERFSENVKRFNNALAKDIRKVTDELQKFKLELSGKEQERSSLSEQLAKKKDELKEYEDKIFNECGTQNLDEGVENLDAELSKKRESKALLEGTNVVFSRYIEKLRKSEPPCPLCHRDFNSSSEVDDLIDELDKRLELVPTKLATVDDEIDKLQQKYNQVLTLRPYKSSIADLRDDSIPSFKKRVSAVEERISFLRGQISEKEAVLTEKKEDEERGQSLVPDMTNIDTYLREVKDLERKIELQSAKLMHVDSDRTLQQVQDEKENAQEELDTVRRSVERKQNKMREQEQKLSQLQTRVNQLTTEKLQIESDMQDRKQMEDSMAELMDKNSLLASQIQDARDKLEPLKETVKRLTGERDDISAQKDLVSDEDKDVIAGVQEQIRNIEAYQNQITKYVKDGREKALQDSKDQLDDFDERLSSLQRRIDSAETKIQEVQKKLDTQKTRERELADNLNLRNKKRDVESKEKKITDLKERLGDLDVSSLERDKQRLRAQQEELNREKHQAEGREQSQLDEIRKLKESLRKEDYKNADTNYDKEVILLRTKEMAADDLEKYHRALDRTIMSYHKMKMDDINKIIRELWRKTYRGNDIETIEICHDEDSGTNQARRTYNYRVVMVRNDHKLDLRGRCSAGQRVLASLIIRLALAETFCLNCGILALDEPTTNLDRENIESLAYALVEIIKGRNRQKNFQLIVITHDEDFVELLGRSDYIDKFWKVRKNEFGCSRLVEANVADLGTR